MNRIANPCQEVHLLSPCCKGPEEQNTFQCISLQRVCGENREQLTLVCTVCSIENTVIYECLNIEERTVDDVALQPLTSDSAVDFRWRLSLFG